MPRIAATVAALLILAAPAAAQVPARDPAPAELENVVVEGRRLSETIERFVDDVVAPPVGRGPARWNRKVCVGALNLRREAAQVVLDQVSRIALELGLEPGDPGCKPNIFIIATNDGEGLAKALVERKPRTFRPNYSGAARSRTALERFQSGAEPVRWWHISMPVTETGEPAVRLPGYGPPMIREDGSRLTTRIRNNLLGALVILDLEKMDGVNFQQLGDYIGMIAMAQIDPEAETATYDTVLNLFQSPGAVDGLTDWDRSYLSALYDAELNRRAPSQQGGEVAGLMLRDRLRAETEEPDQ
ncbi:MAG TPA: hypothetical protein VFF48_00855 [Brevundimonas sp.]|nr:hypothetical protein [Brevundimonas sp.]